jgi:transcriptional regulator with XRE-family HTH domain
MTEAPDIPIGERVRFFRRGKGWSQEVLAGIVAITPQYLSGIENGKAIPTIGLLVRMASELGIRAGELLGEPRFLTDTPGHVDAMLAMQRALTVYPEPRTDAAEEDVRRFAARVRAAWTSWHTSPTRFTDVGNILPGAIMEGEALVRGLATPGAEDLRREVYRQLADAYALGQEFTRRVGRAELNLLAADRAARSAEAADDELRMYKARWNVSHALLGDQQTDGSIETALKAAEEIRPRLADAPLEWTAMYSQLILPAVRGEARRRNAGEARRLLHELAEPAARRVGDRMLLWAVSGPLNCDIHAVSVEMEAGSGNEGLRLAEAIEIDKALSIERKTTFFIELARCHQYRNEDQAALLYLRRAAALAPEDVRYHELTRSMVWAILHRAKPAYIGEARVLAEQIGLST